MTISVVMSVYNGEKYLLPQLDSLRNQTVVADEVIILDDCSTDRSYQLIADYIMTYKLNTWHLERNPHNYGWKRSFFEGISKCKGDIIFTCDQDDVWLIDKIEVMSCAIQDNPSIQLLVADYLAFQFDDVPYCCKKKSGKVERMKLGYKWKYIQRPGCVFAFTKKLQKKFTSCWRKGMAHDLLLWELAGVEDAIYIVDYTAIYFRRHDNNATPPKARDREMRLKLSLQSINELNNLRAWEIANSASKNVIEKIDLALSFEKERVEFLSNRKINIRIALKLLKNSEKYLRRLAWGVDMICMIK